MNARDNPQHTRLNQIEGLRGYLALSVVLAHLVHATGYDDSSDPIKLVGALAVKCFIIISGFVIFFLLDTKKEPYRVYITRRFFRIFPVFVFLFALSIPCSLLWHSNFMKCSGLGWFTPQETVEVAQNYNSIWQNIYFHVPAHLLMIHGLIPEPLLPESPIAFLGPAWSLSLEWQFYLVAPLWLYFFTSDSVWKQMLMYLVCFVTMLVSRHFIWLVQQGAALPFHIEFFFFGIVCYFCYRALTKSKIQIKGDTVFPMVFIMSLAIYKWSGKALEVIPFLVWASLFALIIEPASSISSRYICPLFTNRISLWLGKISFSIYLSHMLILGIMQWGLLTVFPDVTQMQHFMILSLLTFGITIPFSAVLYYGIEAPFIKLGKRLTAVKFNNGLRLKKV